MKKIFSLVLSVLLVVAICMGSASFAVAEENVLSVEQELLSFINESAVEQELEQDQKVPCTATMDDPFLDDVVIVTILKEYSGLDKTFSQADFPGVDIAEIEYLTSLKDPDEEYKYLNYDEYRQIIKLTITNPGKENVLDAIDKLEQNPIVRYAGPSRTDLQLDDVIYAQSSESILEGAETYYYDLIDLTSAWELTTGSSAVQVGVIDSGVANHSDLINNLGAGWDFYLNNAITSDDTHGHGTHVASIIHAIAPNVTLVPLQVSYGSYYDGAAISAAVDYAIENEIPILNMSLSNGAVDQDLVDSLENYTGVVCCAAGNLSADNDVTPRYPASYDMDNIISVSATDDNDELCDFSNYGVQAVDIAAPGYNIYSTYPSNTYIYQDGTSMATPMVAGTAALLLAYNPNLTNYQLRQAILSTVDPLSSLDGYVATGGRLNVYNALCSVFSGNRVRTYMTSVMINTPTNISYGGISVNYDRSVCSYETYLVGDIIPNPSLALGADVYDNHEFSYVYSGYSNPVTSAGSFVDILYNSPFVDNRTLSTFSLNPCTFMYPVGTNISVSVSLRTVLFGDVNFDGLINSTDVNLTFSCATSSISFTDTQKAAGDVNLDGAITSQDVLLISQYVSGAINKL